MITIPLFILIIYSTIAQNRATNVAAKSATTSTPTTKTSDVATTTAPAVNNSTTKAAPAATTKPTKVPVAEKTTIKPATAVTPSTTTSKLPETTSNQPADYYTGKPKNGWTSTVAHEYKTMHELLGDRIHIGLRSMTFSLEDTSRAGQGFDNYYLGTIDELHEIQDSSLANVTLGFYPIRNLGIEYRRDEVRARTTTDTDDNHSDGDFVVDGPVFLGIARLPLDQIVTLFNQSSVDDAYKDGATYNIARRIIPYIGIGKAGLEGEFQADTWWANGYASPAAWESLGSPEGVIRNGHTREIKVTDEDVGIYLVYGLSLRVIDNFYADFSFSQVDVDLSADYSLDGAYQYTRTIPMSYSSTSLGIRYYF